jgi:hypothetical protein
MDMGDDTMDMGDDNVDMGYLVTLATPQRKLPEHEGLRGDVVVPPEPVRVAVGVEAHVVGIHLHPRTDQIFWIPFKHYSHFRQSEISGPSGDFGHFLGNSDTWRKFCHVLAFKAFIPAFCSMSLGNFLDLNPVSAFEKATLKALM